MAGNFAAVDSDGRLAELGWVKLPALMHLAWAAQWLDYSRRMTAQLSEPALTLPVFRDQVNTAHSFVKCMQSIRE